VDSGCMSPITGSTCRAKCSNILHDTRAKRLFWREQKSIIRSVYELLGEKNKKHYRFDKYLERAAKWLLGKQTN
jgi:hypothetical protein